MFNQQNSISPQGYWLDEVETNPIAKDFVKNGWASIDEETSDIFRINSQGRDVLHPYIEAVSNDFISFMKTTGFESSEIEIINWFIGKYELSDFETAKWIFEYISRNLDRYGYKCNWFHSSKIGAGWRIEERKL